MNTRSLTLALALLLGCKDDPEKQPADSGPDPDRVARSVTSAEGDIGVMVQGHNSFSFELHRLLSEEAGEDNLFFSPFSITSALGMTLAGAEGQTETEMKDVLHVSGEEAAWHTALGALTRDLDGDFSRGYTLQVANRLFGQEGYPWKEPFLGVCENDYGAPLEPWDFQSDPDGGRDRVNEWVAEQTNDRIQELLPDGSVTGDTRLVLANAIYFLADWATPFDPEDTEDGRFHRLDGSSVTVPMMTMDLEAIEDHGIEVGHTDDAVLLRLPYEDNEVSMILVIPDEVDGLPAIEASLDAATFEGWLDTLQGGGVPIYMPRLEMRTKVNLVNHLSALGMPSAFVSGSADFSGMAEVPEDGSLRLSGVYHEGFIRVDELGTEAAAATGAVVVSDSAPVPIVADHPFLFVIRDDLTGAILFVGRVMDPS